jgi:hypothetical protein
VIVRFTDIDRIVDKYLTAKFRIIFIMIRLLNHEEIASLSFYIKCIYLTTFRIRDQFVTKDIGNYVLNRVVIIIIYVVSNFNKIQ